MHINLRNLEQFSDDGYSLKGVCKGEQSETVLLLLKPGQQLPPHPHDRFEVLLMPQKGVGRMTVDGSKEVDLTPDCVYYEPVGRTIGIANTGDTPLQVLITLVRIGASEPPAELHNIAS